MPLGLAFKANPNFLCGYFRKKEPSTYIRVYTVHQWDARYPGVQGTTLQPGRSRVQFPMLSVEFFSDIILPVPLWPWDRLNL